MNGECEIMLMNDNKNTLNQLKEKNNFILEKMKIDNTNKIEVDKMRSNLNLQLMKSKKDQLNTNREVEQLKRLVKSDKKIIKSGKLLKLFCFIGLCISALITIVGGKEIFDKTMLTLIAFSMGVCLCQGTIFIIGLQESNIRNNFSRHITKILILKYCILAVSIYNNYKFFSKQGSNWIDTVIIIIFCVSIDMTCIFLMSLASDQTELLLSQSKIENLGFFTKLFYNLTAPIQRINDRIYEKNQLKNNEYSDKNLVENDIKFSVEKNLVDYDNTGTEGNASYIKTSKKDSLKVVKMKPKTAREKQNTSMSTTLKTGKSKSKNPVERVKNHIGKSYTPGDKIDIELLKKRMKITKYKWDKCRKELIKTGFLKVENNNTYLC